MRAPDEPRPATPDEEGVSGSQRASAGRPTSKLRIRVFRLIAALAIPLLLLLTVELALRILGIGHETAFTTACRVEGAAARCENPAFSWLYFPRRIARTPVAFSFPETKREGTFRIFVIGGSAAQGDPEPSFGFARILELLLRDRRPDMDFEIVNAGLTAANSHMVLPIARELAREDADLFIVYLGNNEVVGPFGAGTVFSPLLSSRRLIHLRLFLRGTRLGQLLAGAVEALGPGEGPGEWTGMEMFVRNRVSHDDPGLQAVYDHFRENLRDILDAATSAGTPVLVSTVGVNLGHCAPFASLHGDGLGSAELEAFEQSDRGGRDAEAAGDLEGALRAYREAVAIDPAFADLHYRLGRVQLARGRSADALERFVRARDLDVLRFRADTIINEIIRAAAGESSAEGVTLVEGKGALAARSPGGIPGAELFDDHVHLGLEGNYVLARELLRAVERLLPRAADPARGPPLTREECSRRLAYTGYDRRRTLIELVERFKRAPFTNQSDHEESIGRLRRELAGLSRYASPEGMGDAVEEYREALGRRPADPWLSFNYGVLLSDLGDHQGAAQAFGAFLRHLPRDVPGREKLSTALAASGRFEEAAGVCRELIADYPEFTPPYYTGAYALARLGRYDEALALYRRTLRLDADLAPQTWEEMGRILSRAGRTGEAEEAFRRAAELAREQPGP